MASAGHLPPLLVRPDGTSEYLDTYPAPPLGVGEIPIESRTFQIEDGSLLVLYTDGLVEDRQRDIDEGLGFLRGVFDAARTVHMAVRHLFRRGVADVHDLDVENEGPPGQRVVEVDIDVEAANLEHDDARRTTLGLHRDELADAELAGPDQMLGRYPAYGVGIAHAVGVLGRNRRRESIAGLFAAHLVLEPGHDVAAAMKVDSRLLPARGFELPAFTVPGRVMETDDFAPFYLHD